MTYKSIVKDVMKDHEIAALVNQVTKAVKAICPDAPQCTREVISRAILEDGIKIRGSGGYRPDLIIMDDVID